MRLESARVREFSRNNKKEMGFALKSFFLSIFCLFIILSNRLLAASVKQGPDYYGQYVAVTYNYRFQCLEIRAKRLFHIAGNGVSSLSRGAESSWRQLEEELVSFIEELKQSNLQDDKTLGKARLLRRRFYERYADTFIGLHAVNKALEYNYYELNVERSKKKVDRNEQHYLNLQKRYKRYLLLAHELGSDWVTFRVIRRDVLLLV